MAVEIVNTAALRVDRLPLLPRTYGTLVLERIMLYLLDPRRHAGQHQQGSTIPEGPADLLTQMGF